jgi:hypothetical protein
MQRQNVAYPDHLLILVVRDNSALGLSASICHTSDRQHCSIRQVLGVDISGHTKDSHVEKGGSGKLIRDICTVDE